MSIRDSVLKSIQSLIEKEGSKAAFAKKIGVSRAAVTNWTSGINAPDIETIAVISREYRIPLSEMLEGTAGEFLKTDNGRWVDVPLYGSIAAGTPIEMMEVEDTFPVPARMHDAHPDAFLLKVEGESMNRILPNGCYALVDPCETVEENGAPYAVCVNGYDATIKRVRKLNNGFELVPDSTDPTYPVQTYNYNEPGTETITVIGRVVYYVLPFDWSF